MAVRFRPVSCSNSQSKCRGPRKRYRNLFTQEKCRLLPHCFCRQSRLTIWQSPQLQWLFLIRLGSCRIHPGAQRPNIYQSESLALSFLTWMRWQALMTLVWNTWCLIAKFLLWPVVCSSSFTFSQLKLTEEWTEKLGITPTTHVVMWELNSYRTNLCVFNTIQSYDSHGVFSAPRALFMFRSFGHQSSSIIDGGLPRWADEDLPLETTKPTQPQPTHYPAPNLNEEAVKSTTSLVGLFVLLTP